MEAFGLGHSDREDLATAMATALRDGPEGYEYPETMALGANANIELECIRLWLDDGGQFAGVRLRPTYPMNARVWAVLEADPASNEYELVTLVVGDGSSSL